MDEDRDDVDRKADESGEEYDENADEDFNPDQVKEDADISELSGADDEEQEVSAKTVKKKPSSKRKADAPEIDLDSGDEATIKERKAKRRKKEPAHDEDSGEEGGFVRTRRQRAVEKEERRNRKKGVREGAVTIDVDKIWAELSSMPVGRVALAPPKVDVDDMDVDAKGHREKNSATATNQMVKIKRKSKYAGEITYIDVEVVRTSKEAIRYFEKHPELDPDRVEPSAATDSTDASKATNRPLRRPSMFEPNPTGLVKNVAPDKLRLRAPSRIDVLMAQRREDAKKSAVKLSTMQMSQHDWKSYVEKEGLKDELDVYERSGNRFLAREAFLDRAAGAREAAARDARLKI